jgi:hypothetical protein
VFSDSPSFQSFLGNVKRLVNLLDKAIAKFEVATEGSVFSGHGSGTGVLGALAAEPQQLVGLHYCYWGYVSTSWHRDVAAAFIRTRSSENSKPVLLEFLLTPGECALPMDKATGQTGEGEVLLSRSCPFEIREAKLIRIGGVHPNVLHLVLRKAPFRAHE